MRLLQSLSFPNQLTCRIRRREKKEETPIPHTGPLQIIDSRRCRADNERRLGREAAADRGRRQLGRRRGETAVSVTAVRSFPSFHLSFLSFSRSKAVAKVIAKPSNPAPTLAAAQPPSQPKIAILKRNPAPSTSQPGASSSASAGAGAAAGAGGTIDTTCSWRRSEGEGGTAAALSGLTAEERARVLQKQHEYALARERIFGSASSSSSASTATSPGNNSARILQNAKLPRK